MLFLLITVRCGADYFFLESFDAVRRGLFFLEFFDVVRCVFLEEISYGAVRRCVFLLFEKPPVPAVFVKGNMVGCAVW